MFAAMHLIYVVLFISGLAGLIALLITGFAHPHGHHGQGHGHGHAHGDVHGHHGAPAHHGSASGGHGHTNGGHGHANGGHGHAHAAHGHVGHAHGVPAATGAHGHAHAGGHSHGAAHGHDSDNAQADGDDPSLAQNSLMWLLPLLSPLNWFSWFLGAGAAGMICIKTGIHEPQRAVVALLGAILFRAGVVRPIWNAVFQFASKPAGNLESCLMQQVEAVTQFDERGEGLVRMLIDGQSTDVLARLTEEELAKGLRVRRGDQLFVEDVDSQKNTCRVSRV
jgi:hypothetical protein